MKPQIKRILNEQETQDAVRAAADIAYQTAAAAYGAKGGSVILQRSFGDPTLSRDGVTNVSELELRDPGQNAALKVIIQASRKSNETVGDGTTAAVILTKHLLDRARKLVESSVYDRVVMARKLESIIEPIHARLDGMAKKYDSSRLHDVATVSAGDEAIGALIADSIEAVGLDGGIIVERHAGLGIHNELQDGFYVNRGFANPWLINDRVRLRAEHNDAYILIADKQITGLHEIAQILESCGQNNVKRLVIVGQVAGDALSVLIQVHLKGQFDIALVDPAVYAGNRMIFLEDLAVYTRGQVYGSGMSPDQFDIEMLGKAEKVLITEFSTTIIGGAAHSEDIEKRIADIKDDLKKEKDPRSVEAIHKRLSTLTGKICIIRVGGATPSDADYMKLRVDDAVCAVRSAMKSGVLPGGGIALLRCRDVTGDFADALTEPFKQLMANGGLNQERCLAAVEDAPEWHGFDLKNPGKDPIDLLDAGIVDPLEVIKEVVTNATTTAARLIEAKLSIVSDQDGNDTAGDQ